MPRFLVKMDVKRTKSLGEVTLEIQEYPRWETIRKREDTQ